MFCRRRRGKVRAIVSRFGLEPGLSAVWASLLCVRGADRDVQGSVRVAEGGGEDVGGPEIGARGEARKLSLGSAIAGLRRRVHTCSDRVVAAGGLAQGTIGGVGGACVQGSGLTSCTGHGFARPSAAQAPAYRINVLLGLQRWSVMRVEAPHPCVSDLCFTEFQQPREPPRSPRSRASEAAPDGRPCPRRR